MTATKAEGPAIWERRVEGLAASGRSCRECKRPPAPILEARCVGWWPTLADFVAERVAELGDEVPRAALEQLGQDWIDDERISVFDDDGGGLASAGVFVFRVAWW